jgi:3',5'-nucleoside bisphosphate phosphatase
MESFLADLHVHTVLSPCADVEMIPPLIVEEALDRGIRLLAITDHNASANVIAVQQAAKGTGLFVFPGMELQTREEVHSLCLFDTPDQLAEWQSIINFHLPPIQNQPDHFGEQFIVDSTGEFVRRETQLLLTSTSLTFNEACKMVHHIGGLFIPAHVNRQAFGLIANLGFVPADVPVDALEFSRHIRLNEAGRKFPQVIGYSFIQNGDVHRLDEFLGVTEYIIEKPSIDEIRLALQNKAGRSYKSKQSI